VSKSGTPITEELAEQLATEAEAGYDLSGARPVGRRSLSGGSGRSPRLNIRTTVDLYEKAMAKAKREGKTVSQLAREALEKYV
jgi:CRISPR-associated endonuclease/helicase Cas3